MNIEKIRVSIGSASVLGLTKSSKFKDPPTTCYLMTYINGRCSANCGFCPQARSSKSSVEKLSRVSWPVFKFKDLLSKLKDSAKEKSFDRICIQTLNYPENFNDLIKIVPQIKKVYAGSISVAIPPMQEAQLKKLKSIGVDRVGIALDGSTPDIFDKIKGKNINGPYSWNNHFQNLKDALKVFSKGHVSTHLIVGLGETHEEILNLINNLHQMSITTALFAFTPIKGTQFQDLYQPKLEEFRIIQLGRSLIINDKKDIKDFTFGDDGNLVKFNISRKELKDILDNNDAFMTSGCP